jgi:hypothetical protein
VTDFESLLPQLMRAHEATRRLIETTGCQLGASLLAVDLARREQDVAYVRGRYSAAPQQDHWWVETSRLLLDPTRDQFAEDPFTEGYRGTYVAVDRKVGPSLVDELYMHLRFRWSYDRPRRDTVIAIALEYGLDAGRVAEFLALSG